MLNAARRQKVGVEYLNDYEPNVRAIVLLLCDQAATGFKVGFKPGDDW
jgi:hypothetical protein